MNDIAAIFSLHHQLPTRTIGDFAMHDVGFDLAGHAWQRIAHACDARFVFVANRQMQRKIPIDDEIELGEFLRQCRCRCGTFDGGFRC